MNPRRLSRLFLTPLILLTLFAVPVPAANAQEEPITPDDVNRVARRLYCPVCESETLDACRTEACANWRNEILILLQAGATEEEVIDAFIARFGERVVGAPQDPGLRALSFAVPIAAAVIAVIIGALTFARWRGRRAAPEALNISTTGTDQAYRDIIERDIR